ncbi:MAG: BlaI/MecI/CopY family transcriptional regulator [Blastocatellia bacterium]
MLKALFQSSPLSARETANVQLGPLERKVMDIVWQRGQSSVRDIYLVLGPDWAYTTLMTTLDRLHKKGLLARTKEGRAFLYAPCLSASEFARRVARNMLDVLLGNRGAGDEPVLACIVDTVSEHDHALLDELERLVQQKREALAQEGDGDV